MTMDEHSVIEVIEGEIDGQDELARQRRVAGRLVSVAQKGGEHGGILGVEAAMAPAMITAYSIPFLIHFVWGFLLTVVTLIGAGVYGLRRLWSWLCFQK
jgi:hypothetical protein